MLADDTSRAATKAMNVRMASNIIAVPEVGVLKRLFLVCALLAGAAMLAGSVGALGAFTLETVLARILLPYLRDLGERPEQPLGHEDEHRVEPDLEVPAKRRPAAQQQR